MTGPNDPMNSGENGRFMIPVPDPDGSMHEIMRFALSFDGYTLNGDMHGTNKCADLANAAVYAWHSTGELPSTLHELRSCLFFEQRRTHFGGDGPDTYAYMRLLVARIRELSGGIVEVSPTSPVARWT